MKISLIIILILIFSNCSFDKRTGIWNSNVEKDLTKDQRFRDFKTLLEKDEIFNQIISPSENLTISINPQKSVLLWSNQYYNNSNSLENFNYKNLNELIFESKKLSKHLLNEHILYDGDNIITADVKGNLIFYSVENESIFKFNFYRKNFKKIKKNLRIVLEEKIVYVADNIGYLYAFDSKQKKLLWAKDYKVPFRSNLKVINDKIIVANQDNVLLILNKFNGEKLKSFPTEQIILKSNFYNSLATNTKSLFYLNTFGSLYSINIINSNLQWFVSLNESSEKEFTSLFFSHPIFIYGEKIVVSTDPYLYILNSVNGSILFKKPISSVIKPIISGNYLFTISKDNLLICIDLTSDKIIYSISLGKKIAEYLKTKERTLSIKYFSIINSKLYIFLNNSFILKFDLVGEINNIVKLPSKIGSYPIFIQDSFLYLNNKNKLNIVD